MARHDIDRRAFLHCAGAGGLAATTAPGGVLFGRQPPGSRIRWEKGADAALFTQARCDGTALVYRGGYGLLGASCRVAGEGGEAVRLGAERPAGRIGFCDAQLRHRLMRSGAGGAEDVLEAELVLRNAGTVRQTILVEFASSAHPSLSYGRERAHLPLNAGGLGRHPLLKQLGGSQLAECDAFVGCVGENTPPLVCHYREPEDSDPGGSATRALLLIPLVDIYHPGVPWRLALFASPERPWRIAATGNTLGEGGWTCGALVSLEPGQQVSEKCFLFLHEEGPEQAWRVFRQLTHADELECIGWLEDAIVHYYDFLSPSGDALRRGSGYDYDSRHFREFHVGLATQHGYYSMLGDYVHPDRPRWEAMRSDVNGPAAMSLELMKQRCQAARAAGARPAVYIHAVIFDSASPFAAGLEDAVVRKQDGTRSMFDSWHGPETVGKLWHMSLAAPEWRAHLLQQAAWIMELVGPDAIVVDETFGGLGYDHHPGRRGGISGSMIRFVRDLRRLLRSYGSDKALLMSDCCLSSFVQWADGEAGDHAYKTLLGSELYRQPPVRYLAALGRKAWLPGAWQFAGFWDAQMDLARKTGAGVGLSNGWIEYTGLARLAPPLRTKVLSDIRELALRRRARS